MTVEMKSQLRSLREELEPKVSQETMAHKAGITLQWYRQLEAGQNTSYTTAKAILTALNAEREGRGLEMVGLDQLGLKIV
jgi:DNA-binding XRE family transcriptional regulator